MLQTKKYFFFDFDGTLTIGSTACVPPSARKALDLLRANGHSVAVATGRMEADIARFLPDLGIRNAVTDGGYGIVIDGNIVQMKTLDPALCIRPWKNCPQSISLGGSPAPTKRCAIPIPWNFC